MWHLLPPFPVGSKASALPRRVTNPFCSQVQALLFHHCDPPCVFCLWTVILSDLSRDFCSLTSLLSLHRIRCQTQLLSFLSQPSCFQSCHFDFLLFLYEFQSQDKVSVLSATFLNVTLIFGSKNSLLWGTPTVDPRGLARAQSFLSLIETRSTHLTFHPFTVTVQ